MLFSMLRSFSLRRMSSIGIHSSEKASQYPPNSGSRAYRSSSRNRERASSRAESSRVARKYSENRKWQKPGRRPVFADGGFPVGRHAPEDAAVSGIDKMVCQIRSSPPCSLQEFAPRPSPVCRREGPQNPAVQHGALVGGYIRIARAVDTAQETAPKRINRPFHPEGKYVFQQFPLRLATEETQYVVSHGCLFSELGQLFVHPLHPLLRKRIEENQQQGEGGSRSREHAQHEPDSETAPAVCSTLAWNP